MANSQLIFIVSFSFLMMTLFNQRIASDYPHPDTTERLHFPTGDGEFLLARQKCPSLPLPFYAFKEITVLTVPNFESSL